ncbi:uncharacterized protein LOC582352 isoform X1 [Strongylocentrotus purpuratus]|uniref:Uncharacterized protein n=1 Tax=Strongylocentrotus purpuratus TaxID=7668 RepID=A0A7M7LTB8_STRPU|nr:uncharacterized protein LOC582352 isoform X1 [Strongylocentrotus purpuratus]
MSRSAGASRGAGAAMDPLVARRRDQLYGTTRTNAMTAMKESLTQDHIKMIAKEGMRSTSPILNSTTKGAFKGTQPDRSVGFVWDSGQQKILQNQTHFEFRGEAAPVDEKIYKSSLTAADYSGRKAERLPAVKPEDKINLPDMNPRYWRDGKFGQSLYDSDFVGGNTLHNLDNDPAVSQSRNEMRRRNVKDLRTTHFKLGNDPQHYDSETVDSFHKNLSMTGARLAPIPTAPGPKQPEESPSSVARKMIEDERDSAVFRQGDYNVTRPRPGKTTFTHDYNAKLKPDKSAAFIEPTRIAKGRFLQDDPILRSQLIEEGAALLPPIPRDEEAIAKVEATSSTLKQIFIQYDPARVGCVSKEVLRRVTDSLLDPISAVNLDKLITRTHHGKDGTIDYEDFVNNFTAWKLGDEAQRAQGTEAAEPNLLQITPGVLNRGSGKSAGTAEGSPMLDNASRGKEYQTSVHFKFGTDQDPAASIYNKDYIKERTTVVMPTKEPPPKPSEVMHKTSDGGFEKSTKQSDYTDFSGTKSQTHLNMMDLREMESLRNKRRHNVNNVIFTCDRERDAVDRQDSLSHTNYVKHALDGDRKGYEVTQSKYRYLDTVGCLPYEAHIPSASETSEAFDFRSKLMNDADTNARLRGMRNEKKERVEDARRVHFKFGNDGPSHVTEAQDCFTDENYNGLKIPAAGKKNESDPNYRHTYASENTQDLKQDPMRPTVFETIRMAKKSYYNNTPNPRDPLHIKLRQSLMAADPERTGRLSKAQMKGICGEFQINVSQKALNSLLQRCDRIGDGSVDYDQFVKDLTLEQVPKDMSAAHSSSTMSHDYKPLNQRSHTDAQLLTIQHMNRKPIAPAQSHFFHADPFFSSPFESISNLDFGKPELKSS